MVHATQYIYVKQPASKRLTKPIKQTKKFNFPDILSVTRYTYIEPDLSKQLSENHHILLLHQVYTCKFLFFKVFHISVLKVLE
jgi:hypothetical protein